MIRCFIQLRLSLNPPITEPTCTFTSTQALQKWCTAKTHDTSFSRIACKICLSRSSSIRQYGSNSSSFNDCELIMAFTSTKNGDFFKRIGAVDGSG
jgi:hypothetical protein